MPLKVGKDLQTDNVFKDFLFLDNWINERYFSNDFIKTKKRGLEFEYLHLWM